MRHPFYALLFFVSLTAAAPAAEGPTLKDARQRWLKGNYEEAKAQYETLAKDAKLKNEAMIGLSRVLQSQGEYDKAQETIDTALKDDPKTPDLLARRADLLYFRGNWDDAFKAAEEAIAKNEDQFLARWIRAHIYFDRADFDKADAEFRWFVKKYVELDEADKPIKDPDTLLLVGLAGTE